MGLGAQTPRFSSISVCVCVSFFQFAKKGLLRKERDLERGTIIRVQGCGKGKQEGGTNGRWACEIRIVACILDWK
jgi:hypothetical protein